MDIETIIKSLERAESDNKKFALLLILSELIKTKKLDELKDQRPDEDEEAARKLLNKRLFNSISSHFLARLLTTKQAPENTSPLMYKCVSMSIITQFIEYPELITDPILLTKLDNIICTIFENVNLKESESAQRNLIFDTFKYLFAISEQMPSYLFQNTKLIETLINKLILNELFHEKSDSNQIGTDLDKDDDDNLVLVACKLFLNLCKQHETEENIVLNKKYKDEQIEKGLKSLLIGIETNQTKFKFTLIHYLNYIMENQNVNDYLKRPNMDEPCSQSLFNIIDDLFKSKLNESNRQIAFSLLNNFIRLYQFEYIYMKNRNFFYLLIHLLCIQITINLQNYSQDENSNKDFIKKLSTYYSLLEEVIIILSTASPFDSQNSSASDSDDQESKNDDDDNYEPEFKKVIKIIVETLETIILYVKDSFEACSDNYEKLTENNQIIIVSSIRLLLCWLTHETLLEEDLLNLFPRIINFCDYFHSSCLNTYEINVFEFLMPGLQRVLNDLHDKLQMESQNKKDDEVTVEFNKTKIKEEIRDIENMIEKCTDKIDS